MAACQCRTHARIATNLRECGGVSKVKAYGEQGEYGETLYPVVPRPRSDACKSGVLYYVDGTRRGVFRAKVRTRLFRQNDEPFHSPTLPVVHYVGNRDNSELGRQLFGGLGPGPHTPASMPRGQPEHQCHICKKRYERSDQLRRHMASRKLVLGLLLFLVKP